MIYVSNKLKYLFDYIPTMVNEDGVEFGKMVYANRHEDEVKDIPYDDWAVIHKNGEPRDVRSENLELVIFKED